MPKRGSNGRGRKRGKEITKEEFTTLLYLQNLMDFRHTVVYGSTIMFL